MKKLLNTLYITTQGAYIARDNETVVVRVEKETRLRVPIHVLDGIVCFGRVGASPALMGLCGERGVALSFMGYNGRFLARVQGPVSGNVLLRREQYRRADDIDDPGGVSAIARAVVLGKIANSRTVLQRAARERGENAPGAQNLQFAIKRLARLLDLTRSESTVDNIRGREGDAARVYFDVFDHLIVAQKEGFFFHGRNRRPPLDNMNALLSFLYTLLTHDCAAGLEGVGLDPQVGFLHRDRPGRPGLALDLMEEMRPFMADRLALSLVNRQQAKAKRFTRSETGAVMMDDKTRKDVLVAWQKRKQELITHPFLQQKICIGLIPHVQAMLLARHLRGDLDGYPPFVWR